MTDEDEVALVIRDEGDRVGLYVIHASVWIRIYTVSRPTHLVFDPGGYPDDGAVSTAE
jgi:hypothetical protein